MDVNGDPREQSLRRSLRLIVFDRSLGPPDILHRARKAAWKAIGTGNNAYDDMLAPLGLKRPTGG